MTKQLSWERKEGCLSLQEKKKNDTQPPASKYIIQCEEIVAAVRQTERSLQRGYQWGKG